MSACALGILQGCWWLYFSHRDSSREVRVLARIMGTYRTQNSSS